MWVYSVSYLERGPHKLHLEIRLQTAQEALKDSLDRYRRHSADGQAQMLALEIQSQDARLRSASAILTRNVPSRRAVELAQKDIDLADRLYPRSGIRINRVNADLIQFLSAEGEVTGFHSVSNVLENDWTRGFESALTREQLCEQILRPTTNMHDSYAVISKITFNRGWNKSACAKGLAGEIEVEAFLNKSNVDYGQLLVMNMSVVFQNMVASLPTGFRTYASSHPLHYVRVFEDSSVWMHKHVISEDESGGLTRIDSELAKSYLAEEGVGLSVLSRTLPAGTIISAIMATSFFTIILLVSATSSIMLAAGARTMSRLSGVFLVQRYPFVFVMTSAGIVASIFRILFL